MTSERQRRIHEWARNTLRRFSIVYSPSVLGEIPVDLDDNLDLLDSFSTALFSPILKLINNSSAKTKEITTLEEVEMWS